MKSFLVPLIIAAITVTSICQSCKKDKPLCTGDIEIKGANHLVDISSLKAAPQLLDTLAKYPELQVISIIDDEYQIGMICNYFYKGLICFGSIYCLYKDKKDKSLYCQDYTPKVAIQTNIAKIINYQKALEIAKREQIFYDRCLTYQLGYSYQDTSIIETPNSYKLVWKVEMLGGGSYVILDANSGYVYSKFDGMFR